MQQRQKIPHPGRDDFTRPLILLCIAGKFRPCGRRSPGHIRFCFALRANSGLAGVARSVTYDGMLPRLLLAKPEFASHCFAKWPQCVPARRAVDTALDRGHCPPYPPVRTLRTIQTIRIPTASRIRSYFSRETAQTAVECTFAEQKPPPVRRVAGCLAAPMSRLNQLNEPTDEQ